MTMKLDELFARQRQTLSFEFFPPKTDRGWFTLEDTIDQLVPLGPDFMSVTYGAGGSTRAKTREVVQLIQKDTGITAMAHLTCVNATKEELRGLLQEYQGAGIQNILALRGDPPKGQERFIPTDGGCAYAGDLIDLIRTEGSFAILCAAFPEKHPHSPSREADWLNLQRKLERGACAAITQCFFELTPYLELVAFMGKVLNKPVRIIPGILPIVDWGALQRFCGICEAAIPAGLRALMEPKAQDPVAQRKAGMGYTIELCRKLLENGAPGLHIYALNRSTAAAEIVTALRLSGHLS
jgi:methylenetetrahydrofolate reductase (NADPH)